MMKLGKAYGIFRHIGMDDVTDEQKGEAILIVADMPTHNGITKDQMLDVIKYLLPFAFDVNSNRCRHESTCGYEICNLEADLVKATISAQSPGQCIRKDPFISAGFLIGKGLVDSVNVVRCQDCQFF